MSLRKTIFIQKEYYHLYNRGNSKQVIFHDQEDKDRFMYLMFISNNTNRFNVQDIKRNKVVSYKTEKGLTLVSVGAYCLMDNHFHILVTQISDDGISKFMQKLSTAYVMYYNKKYNRTGGLFEGKFKARHIDSDRYMKYIFSYIHLNPAKFVDQKWKDKDLSKKKKMKEYIANYPYSSCIDFLKRGISAREESAILDVDSFPDYFPTKNIFEKEVYTWIKLKPF